MTRVLAFLGWLLACMPSACGLAPAFAQASGPGPPARSLPYKRMLIREGRAVLGLTAPISMFAAQIQTESAWRPGAHSIYAAGLAQFIPSTADAMAEKYQELADDDPLNPQWAIRALVRYDRDLYQPIRAISDCDRWAFTLSAYNGGPGWIARDRALCVRHGRCNPLGWWNNVERFTSRSKSNAQQNREYPRRILKLYQPAYRSWGGYVSCGG